MKLHLIVAVVCSALGITSLANAATLTPVNRDPVGQGLNDPSAAGPVGDNPGTTIGEQRRIAYQFAADLWGAVLESDVEIRVGASFQALTCTSTTAVLGSAGPWWVNRDFDRAPVAGIWYPAALANSLARRNLNAEEFFAPDDIDISSRFNANLGGADCLAGSGWYYGLDGQTPAGRINFLNVVMHEIGHGLGVVGFLNKTTGALANFDGLPRSDAYTNLAYDNVQGLRFAHPNMTDALRAAAMRAPGRTVWDGAAVNLNAALILDQKTLLRASGTLTADYEFGTAAFGPVALPLNFTGSIQLADDGIGPDLADACTPIPAGSLAGRVAYINRGTCGFELKVVNAQNAGAIAVLIGNIATSAPGLITMADDPTLTADIPALMVVFQDGSAIKAALPGVNVTIGQLAGRLAGADPSGRVQLYAPTTVAGGSTFSHFDTALAPNALMEPFITSTLNGQFNVDLTAAMFKDIGWVLYAGNARVNGCNSGINVVTDGGLVAGANAQAWSNLCRYSTGLIRNGSYQGCMEAYKDRALASGLLVGSQGGKLMSCAARPAR